MKKFLLAASFFAMTTAAVTAQQTTTKFGTIGIIKFYAGVLNLTNVKNGFIGSFGSYARIPLVKKLSLQPELLFSFTGTGYKGWRTDEESQQRYSYKDTLSLNYINLPVMLQYEFIKGLRVEAGPQFDFLVGGRNEWWRRFEDGSKKKGSENVKDIFKTHDFGLDFGLDYEITSWKGSVDLGVRYNLGLTDIAENFDGKEGKVRNKNIYFGVGIGYIF